MRVIIPVFGGSAAGVCLRFGHLLSPQSLPTEIPFWLVPPGRPGGRLQRLPVGSPVATRCGKGAWRKGTRKQALLPTFGKVRRRGGPGEVLNVIIPEPRRHFGLRYIVRERQSPAIKAALLAEPEVVVTKQRPPQGLAGPGAR